MDNVTCTKVSIGMPVYNGASHIREALDSLLGQSFQDFELIISDNASDDGTKEIVIEYANKYHNVRYIRQEQNIGSLANFEWVLNNSSSDLFMWAAHDDKWHPNFLEETIRLLEKNPESVMAFCALQSFSYDGKNLEEMHDLSDIRGATSFSTRFKYLGAEERDGKANVIYSLMRREALRAAGGMKIWGDDNWGCDMQSVFAILQHGNIVFSNNILFFKRKNRPNIEETVSQNGFSRKEKLERKLKSKKIWLSYWKGYYQIIKNDTDLTIMQKLQLYALLLQRSRAHMVKTARLHIKLLLA